MKLGWRGLTGALVGGAVAACSPLRAFDALVPKDGGVVVSARDVAYGDGARRRLDVYAPRVPSKCPRPVIVFFYGGSWSSGTKAGYSFVGRALAARGFVTVIPDYRLVPEVRFPDFLRDNAAAVRWTRANVAHYGGDPARLVLAGHSAGAYDAAMLALDPQWLGADRPAVKGWAGLAGPYDFLPFDQPVTRATFSDAPDPRATQPLTFVSAGDPPALLATGDRDTTVLPRNSDALAARLAAASVPVERTRYARLGHVGMVTALARPFRKRAPVLDDLTSFARRVTNAGDSCRIDR